MRVCKTSFLFLILIGLGFAGVRPMAAGERLNVIVFLVDDLGATDLGFAGSDFYKTPNLDKLASQSVRFTTSYSACTVCSPTRAALLTGKYPARLLVTDWIPGERRTNTKLKLPEWTQFLALEEVTLAEVFKSAGYATASIGKWHLGDEAYWPEKQGFDVNIGGWNKGQPPSYFAPYKIPTLAEGPKGEYLADREAAETCKFIEANKGKPFFVYQPCHLVHTPLQAKPEYQAKYQTAHKEGAPHQNATYAAMMQSLDEQVGAILAKLDELKLSEKTVVVFTADNGGLSKVTTNLGLRAGKGSVYEGGVRVPFLIRVPGIPANTCAQPVITPDLYPTLLELCGLSGDAAHNKNVDGLSFAKLLKEPAAALDRKELYWHYPHYHGGGATPYSAIRDENLRLIEFHEDQRVELYDLAADPREEKDLAKDQPQKTEELRAKLKVWRARIGAQMPTPNPNYNPDASKGSKSGDKKKI